MLEGRLGKGTIAVRIHTNSSVSDNTNTRGRKYLRRKILAGVTENIIF